MKTPMIHLSDSATYEILRLKARQKSQDTLVRLSIQPGGCLGMFYVMGFGNTLEPDDQLYNCGTVQIIIDAHSALHLNGLTLDYSEDLMGGGFRFQNPNVTQSCSCGNSFSLTSDTKPKS